MSTPAANYIERLLTPEVILPSQITLKAIHEPGEVKLQRALFEEALRRLHSYSRVKTPAATDAAAEAHRWFFDARRTWGSFLYACDILGRDPSYWRRAAAVVVQGGMHLPRVCRQSHRRTRTKVGSRKRV